MENMRTKWYVERSDRCATYIDMNKKAIQFIDLNLETQIEKDKKNKCNISTHRNKLSI